MSKIPKMPSRFHFKNLEKNPSNIDILKFMIRQIYKRGIVRKFYMSSQYASLIFGNGIDDQDKVSKVRSHFKQYIEYQGRKFRFKVDMLYDNYPDIWGVSPEPLEIDLEIAEALNQEISSQIKEKKFLSLFKVQELDKVDGKFIYIALYNDEDESQVILPEGVDVDLFTGSSKISVTVLDQDNSRSAITFSSDISIEFGSKTRLSANPERLLIALRDKIKGYQVSSIFHSDLYTATVNIEKNVTPVKFEYSLSNSQREALHKSLNQDLNYIWGPPGTGKTHLLARLLLNLFLAGERTIVCSIANVAVDGITLKFLELVDEYESKSEKNILQGGKVLRLGYVKSEQLLERDEIYPENKLVKSLVYEKEQLYLSKSKTSKDSSKYAVILSKIHELEKKIQEEIKRLINNAQVVFCTSSKAVIDDTIYSSYFDNLIIDEGSMMSPASLFALLRKQPKRVVIAGDFRQLGPIAIGRSAMIDKWLKRSLFDLLGSEEDIPKHSAVSLLREQRRSNKAIVDLISPQFYENLLISIPNVKHNHYINLEPNSGKAISFINLTRDPKYRVQRSKSQSRYNLGSLNKGVAITRSIIDRTSDISIGIITPYKAQANLYKKKIEAFSNENSFFKPKIKIGTIHSFQGSESDVIIFDMVDSLKDIENKNIPIGNLYQGKTGEQLINVAVSRTISKLIIIGCKDLLNEGDKRHLVFSKTKAIIRNAYKFSVKQ